jgi:hypothetical protein
VVVSALAEWDKLAFAALFGTLWVLLRQTGRLHAVTAFVVAAAVTVLTAVTTEPGRSWMRLLTRAVTGHHLS